MLQKGLFSFLHFFFWPWYYYAEASNSWVAWKFIFPQKNHLACLLMAESASWHTYKRESLFYQQQLCLSFNPEQQTGNQGTVQEAIPGKLRSEISFERKVMESNYVISLSFSVAIFSFFFLKRILEWNRPSFRRKVYWFSFMSFSFFPSLICELLKGHLPSLRWGDVSHIWSLPVSVPQWFPWLRRIWFFLKYYIWNRLFFFF